MNNIISNIRNLEKEKIIEILQYKDVNHLKLLNIARDIRNNGKFKNKAELRSVIEISNICSQKCKYCSIGNKKEGKFIQNKNDIIKKVRMLADKGRRTFLLQSGESKNQKFIDDISSCCEEIKNINSDIQIILCLGNLTKRQYKQLKDAGADRYVLKFETSNAEHHKFCRPSDNIENRLECINNLIDLDFKVGSGNIVGLPMQTLDNLYEDLVLINSLKLSMVSATKFIPNEFSEFRNYPAGDINLTLNFIAVLRILKPECLIPSTSSLSIDNKNGQYEGLMAGCNTVTIHDGTPKEFEKQFMIYSKDRFTPAEEFCRNIIKDASMIPENKLIL